MSHPPPFSVRRSKPELVAPAKPTPRGLKRLSDIDDQESLRWDVPVTLIYRAQPSAAAAARKDPVSVIRKAIAGALVFYYPLAGRLVEAPDRKLLVNCTGEGVAFVEAEAEIGLEEVGDAVTPPCRQLEDLIYAEAGWRGALTGRPLLSFQVTRFRCGGFVVGLSYHHTMCDAAGAVQFLNAVAEMALGSHAPSIPPVWQREAFRARRPPAVTCTHLEFSDPKANKTITAGGRWDWTLADAVQSSFFFGPKEIGVLKSQLPPNQMPCSSSEVVTACLFRCRVKALGLPPDEPVRVSFAIAVRSLPRVPVPAGYYGNAFVYPAAVAPAGWVCEEGGGGRPPSVGNAVDVVRKARAQASEDYVRSLADFQAIHGRPTSAVDSYIVSDVRLMGFERVDFGWGEAAFGGVAAAVSNASILVRFRNRKGDDGIVALIALPPAAVKRFQDELKTMTRVTATVSSSSRL